MGLVRTSLGDGSARTKNKTTKNSKYIIIR